MARRIHARLPDSVSLEDLVGAGIVGLINAVDNFDPDRDVKLNTYAEHRIRGAILDYCRKQDSHTRLQRKVEKCIDRVVCSDPLNYIRRLEAIIHSNVKAPGMQGYQMRVDLFGIVEARLRREGVGISVGSGPVEPSILPNYDELLDNMQDVQSVRDLIQLLPDQLRHIIVEYYYYNRTMTELRNDRRCNVSRISQLHKKAVEILRQEATKLLVKQKTGAKPGLKSNPQERCTLVVPLRKPDANTL
jgi:RNA polymerase sigma factor for flagellar operon FliA